MLSTQVTIHSNLICFPLLHLLMDWQFPFNFSEGESARRWGGGGRGVGGRETERVVEGGRERERERERETDR